MEDLAYKGYGIRSVTHQVPETEEWEAEAIILERRGESTIEHIFPTAGRFASKESADRASLWLGRRIIDRKAPDRLP